MIILINYCIGMCLLAISTQNQPWQSGYVPNESVAHSQEKESTLMDWKFAHTHLLFLTTMPEMKHSQAVPAKLGVCPVMGHSQASPALLSSCPIMVHSHASPALFTVCPVMGHSHASPAALSPCPGMEHLQFPVPSSIELLGHVISKWYKGFSTLFPCFYQICIEL